MTREEIILFVPLWFWIWGGVLMTLLILGIVIVMILRSYKYQMSVFSGVLPKRGERYFHKKTGHVYTVLGVGRHHDNHDEFIIYENEGNGEIWLREPVSWMSPAADGSLRFKFVDNEGKIGRGNTTVELLSPAPSVVTVTGPGAVVVTEKIVTDGSSS